MKNSRNSLRMLRLPDVLAKTGLGRDSVYKGAREGWFPKPVKISERASGWLEHEIDNFLAERVRASRTDTGA